MSNDPGSFWPFIDIPLKPVCTNTGYRIPQANLKVDAVWARGQFQCLGELKGLCWKNTYVRSSSFFLTFFGCPSAGVLGVRDDLS
jgi:hypothetical protein